MTQNRDISGSGFDIEAPLALARDEVQLWRVDLAALGEEEPRWRRLLSPDELARADRFHFSRDRQNFVACRAMVRKVLGAYVETNAAELRFAYSSKEKPSLSVPTGSDVSFNIAHSGGIALLAFTRGRQMGVDVEQIRRDLDPEPIARRFFSSYEQKELALLPPPERLDAFFRCWTRKEAYIKATGDGLSLPLSQFDVSLSADEKDALLATRPDAGEAQRWMLREVSAGSGYAAALCVQGRNWTLKA